MFIDFLKKNRTFFKNAAEKLLPPKLFDMICRLEYDLNWIIYSLALNRTGRHTRKLIRENIDTVKDFRVSLTQMLFDYGTAYPINTYIDSYKNKSVQLIKPANKPFSETSPVLLCVVKNDSVKIKAQLDYHRRIGIRHFAYIDNISTDGIFEWLLEQDDVSLFRTNEPFNDIVKESWKKQAADMLGYEKWYLLLDPDEFFTYPGIEDSPIHEYIAFLEKRTIKTVPSLMVDMYSKEGLFKSVNDDFMKDYRFFDTDTYRRRNIKRFQFMDKGPRWRLFSDNDTVVLPVLTRYALIKLSRSMVMSTHKNHPNSLNFRTSGAAAFLLHYKFLPYEKLKYNEFAKPNGINSLAHGEYRQLSKVFSNNPNLSFYFDGSQQFNNSMDLMKINIIDKDFFKRFFAYGKKASTYRR
jgi:hypothetical protein